MPSRGHPVLLTQRVTLHATIAQDKPQRRLCEPSKSHLRQKSRSYDIAIAARRRLLKFRLHQFHYFYRKMSPECRPPPRFFPRTPPSQAMAVSRGSCLGRVLWRSHVPHPILGMPSHVHPYPHGLPANVATLPAPISCTYSRSKRAVRSC